MLQVVAIICILWLFGRLFYRATDSVYSFAAVRWFIVDYFSFLRALIKGNLSTFVFTPLIVTVFSVILISNLVGLLPFTTTIFAQISATLSLSLFVYLTILIGFISKRKLRAIDLFLPKGTPLFIIPLLVIVEVVSILSRVISLSVRLFANLTAGHILLKIFSTFTLSLLSASLNPVNILGSVLLILAIILITSLELLICVLQTYVYITLLLLYIHEVEGTLH